MDPLLLSNEGTLTTASEASSLTCLLDRGIQCTCQGRYAEGVVFFTLARQQLSADQMYFAAVLDAVIQSHANYLQAQQTLHLASKHLVEADIEQQTQLVALEKLLLGQSEEIDRASQPHTIAQPTKNFWEHQSSQSPQLPSTDSNFEQTLPLDLSPKGCDILPALHIICFGRFEVRRLGQPILHCSSSSGQSILRYLVAQPGHRTTIDVLRALLWPEDEPEVAQPKLHSAISALRRSLNHGYNCNPGCGYIVCKNRIYHLNQAVMIRTDVDEFLQCYEAKWQTSKEQVALYEKACSLYTGPFLPEDLYADWSFLQREHLNRIYLAMCKVLTDHYLQTKHYEDAVKWATAILKVNRCDEAAHRQLIQVYTAQGRRSEALQQFQRCKRFLRQELGVAPLPETTHLFQKLLTSEPSSYTDTAKMQ